MPKPRYTCTACNDTGIHKLSRKTCPCRTGDIVEEPPKPLTFDEWVEEIQRINHKNLADSNCLMLTSIQWQEMKDIVYSISSERDMADSVIEDLKMEREKRAYES